MTKTDASGYTDVELLRRHRDAAMVHLKQVPSRVGKAAFEKVDPRPIVRTHPWLSLAGVSGGVAVLTWLVMPGPVKKLRKRVASLERLAKRPSGGITGVDTTIYVDGKPVTTGLGGRGKAVKVKESQSWSESIAEKGFALFRPILAAAVSNWMHAGVDGPGQDDAEQASASALAAESA